MSNKETKLQPELFDLSKEQSGRLDFCDLQPGLFDLPETIPTADNFLTPDGKKKNTIPTGMTKPEIKKLKENKGRRRTRNANWPNDY